MLANPDIFQVASSSMVTDGPMDVTLISTPNDEYGWLSMQPVIPSDPSSSSLTLDPIYQDQSSLDWMQPGLQLDSQFPGYNPYDTIDPNDLNNQFAYPNPDSIPLPDLDLQPDNQLVPDSQYSSPSYSRSTSVTLSLDSELLHANTPRTRDSSFSNYQAPADTPEMSQYASGQMLTPSSNVQQVDKPEQQFSNPASRVSSFSSTVSHVSVVIEAKGDTAMHSSSSLYQPPAGAAHSMTRRVGGSWHNMPLDPTARS